MEARRVLLSDIGFTSMVPELSRSADHLCPPNVKPPPVTTYGQFLRTPDLYSPGFTVNHSQSLTQAIFLINKRFSPSVSCGQQQQRQVPAKAATLSHATAVCTP